MVTVYILQLQSGKYYVGKTNNIDFRLADHFEGAASVWTTRYRPIRIEQIIPGCDDFDEDKYTKICMAMYGIENVRGGSYSQLVLTQAVKDLLETNNHSRDELLLQIRHREAASSHSHCPFAIGNAF